MELPVKEKPKVNNRDLEDFIAHVIVFFILGVSIFIIIGMTGCSDGNRGPRGETGPQGETRSITEPCSILDTDDGAIISCIDGSLFFFEKKCNKKNQNKN
jgi:hypothetical protein